MKKKSSSRKNHAHLSAMIALGVCAVTGVALMADLTVQIHDDATIRTTTNASSSSSVKVDDDDNDREDDGESSNSFCILTKSSCKVDDPGCVAAPTISRIDCHDSECNNSGENTRCNGPFTELPPGVVMTGDQTTTVVPAIDETASSRMSTPQIVGPDTTVSVPDGTTTTTTTSGTSDQKVETGVAAGCFAADGTWTTDRARCDTNQGKYLQTVETTGQTGTTNPSSPAPTETTATNVQYQRAIDVKFVTTVVRDEREQTLLINTADALERLDSVLEKNILSPEAAASVRVSADILRKTLADVSTNELGSNEIQDKAEEVREALATAQNSLLASVPEAREPSSLTGKFDRIFAALPDVIKLLQTEQIPLTQSIIAPYGEASVIYAQLKPVCELDAGECVRLQSVFDRLQSMMDAMKQAMADAGKSHLEEQINLMFQQE